MAKEQVLIFDLENILFSYDSELQAENELIYCFLRDRNYLFDPLDLEGKTPYEFMLSIEDWQKNDAEVLATEIRKIRREALLCGKGAPSVSGVLQALSVKYHIIVLSRSQGDGLVRALAKIGIRNYVDYIIPGEDWVNESSETLGLELSMAKYPKIPLENWSYICLPDAAVRGKSLGMKCYPYGKPPFIDLEDIMEEFV